ncbi:MAG: hypothetical protein H6Q60_812 [Oscillospiraceae bacterium]|nr:hypothetical protein [Oscillospiraceae bacterium]
MNIFYDYEDIFGRAETAHLNRSFTELFEFAAGIRCRLGKQAYLIDEYISLMLEGANATLVHSAAEDGFATSAELRRLCRETMNGKPDCAGHPLYEKARAYISEHPLPFQERVTRQNLYCVALAGDYLEYAAGNYRQEQKELLQNTLDIVHLRDLYRTVSGILGNESELERLNLLLRQRFLVVTPMSVFLQGLTNDLLYSLISRDMETGKRAAQLWLEEETRK